MALLKFTTNINLYNSYFDKNNNLTPKSVLAIFQDVASVHAEEIGIGYDAMLKQNIYWVISRIKFDIIKQPTLNQEVIVETWPHEKGIIDFDRDMKIKSLSGETLVVASSKWCVIDTQTRLLQKADNINYNGECIPDKNYEEKFTKITLPSTELTHIFDYPVRFCDLDHNGHMNNTYYANLVSSAVQNKTFSHFEINFVNECLEGDTISVFYTGCENSEYVIGKVGDKTAFVSYIK